MKVVGGRLTNHVTEGVGSCVPGAVEAALAFDDSRYGRVTCVVPHTFLNLCAPIISPELILPKI